VSFVAVRRSSFVLQIEHASYFSECIVLISRKLRHNSLSGTYSSKTTIDIADQSCGTTAPYSGSHFQIAYQEDSCLTLEKQKENLRYMLQYFISLDYVIQGARHNQSPYINDVVRSEASSPGLKYSPYMNFEGLPCRSYLFTMKYL